MRALGSFSMNQIIANDTTGLETHDTIQDRLFELFKRKNSDYGNSFEVFGKVGIIVRLLDKINRILNLLYYHKENKVADESIKDTWEDLYNYTILAIISE